jgi:hypothetical protein
LNVAAAEKYSINVGGVIEIIVIAVRNAGNPASECQKKAKKIYRKTEKGKKQHAASEKKRRSKKKRLIKQPLKKYQSCMCIMMNLLQKYKRETKAKCQSCEIEGEVMEKFSKRGY